MMQAPLAQRHPVGAQPDGGLFNELVFGVGVRAHGYSSPEWSASARIELLDAGQPGFQLPLMKPVGEGKKVEDVG
ncbi:MAG: hypothetical protein ACK56G_15860, partial [Pirellulaceae bacterium]